MRLAFLGTPEVARRTLTALAGAGHEIAVAVTRPDTRRGRGSALVPSPVSAAASELGIPVSHSVGDAASCGAELGVVVAYGRLVPPSVLARLSLVNVHFSLLPRWRGAAPVERAILAGDAETGVCLMEVVEELDAGGVFDARRVRIGAEETAGELRDRLSILGTEMVIAALQGGPSGLGTPEPQCGEPTWAEKIRPGELAIDWSQPADRITRVVRLGRAWTTFRGRRLTVWRARLLPGDAAGSVPEGARVTATGSAPTPGTLLATTVSTGQGWLELLEVQPEGKKSLAAAEWARGARLDTGESLGTARALP